MFEVEKVNATVVMLKMSLTEWLISFHCLNVPTGSRRVTNLQEGKAALRISWQIYCFPDCCEVTGQPALYPYHQLWESL